MMTRAEASASRFGSPTIPGRVGAAERPCEAPAVTRGLGRHGYAQGAPSSGDWRNTEQKVSNRSFFGKPQPASCVAGQLRKVELASNLAPGRYRLTQQRTAMRSTTRTLPTFKMGAPDPTPSNYRLQALTRDLPERERELRWRQRRRPHPSLPLRTNDVVFLSLEPLRPDRG